MLFLYVVSCRRNTCQRRKMCEWPLLTWKKCWIGFLGEVVWWAFRYLGVDEWIVSVIKAMYEDATTKVRVNGKVRLSVLE